MYCPKIQDDQIRKLYFLKIGYSILGIKKPITKIVREAIDSHITIAIEEIKRNGGEVPEDLISI